MTRPIFHHLLMNLTRSTNSNGLQIRFSRETSDEWVNSFDYPRQLVWLQIFAADSTSISRWITAWLGPNLSIAEIKNWRRTGFICARRHVLRQAGLHFKFYAFDWREPISSGCCLVLFTSNIAAVWMKSQHNMSMQMPWSIMGTPVWASEYFGKIYIIGVLRLTLW